MTGQEYNENLIEVISELKPGKVDTLETIETIYTMDDLDEDMPEIIEEFKERSNFLVPDHLIEDLIRSVFIVAYENLIEAMNRTLCSKNQTNFDV